MMIFHCVCKRMLRHSKPQTDNKLVIKGILMMDALLLKDLVHALFTRRLQVRLRHYLSSLLVDAKQTYLNAILLVLHFMLLIVLTSLLFVS